MAIANATVDLLATKTDIMDAPIRIQQRTDITPRNGFCHRVPDACVTRDDLFERRYLQRGTLLASGCDCLGVPHASS